MKRAFAALAAALAMTACSGPTATVNFSLKEKCPAQVQLYRLDLNRLTLVDSLSTKNDGSLKYKISLGGDTDPEFYYFYKGDVKLAGIVASKGDNISVCADTLGRYDVQGSEDSALLKQMDDRLDSCKMAMQQVLQKAPADENVQLSRLYIAHKRAMLRQVMEHPYSITSAAALFQKINDNLYVFQEPSDVYVFTAIRDSLLTVYPDNAYVNAVTRVIDQRHSRDELEKLLSEAEEGVPDIRMNDISGVEHSLGELKGQVILLSFWSTQQTEHKIFNQEMIPVYEKYHSRGFEIYQVCVDEKTTWASVVRSQKLPWISVNDGLGINSPAVASYNLNSIPTMFIISRSSGIVAKDVYDPAEVDKIVNGLI